MSLPVVNLVIPTFNRLELTKKCLFSLKKCTRHPHVVTVVDNGSSDGTPDFLRLMKAEGVVDNLFLLERNMGISVACNLGWAMVDAPLFMKLDNDMELQRPGWLSEIVELWMSSHQVSVMGPRLPQSTHRFAEQTLDNGRRVQVALSSLSGAMLFVPRDVHDELGFFNEEYGLYGEEDADYSHRAKTAGYRLTVFDTVGMAEHLGGYPDGDEYVAFKRRIKMKNFDKDRVPLFPLNCYLYSKGLRSLRVERKYLPERTEEGGWRFRVNRDYKTLSLFLRECSKIISAIPAKDRDLAVEDPEFIQRLRDLKARVARG